MTPNNLKKQVREILTKLDKGGYLDGRGVEEAEQAIYDLMLEVIPDDETTDGVPNNFQFAQNVVKRELRQLIKEAKDGTIHGNLSSDRRK